MKENKKKRMLLIDAQNQFLRSYIVDPSLSPNGQPIGGSKGFLKILNKLTRETRPDLIVIVWDGEGGSSRRRSVDKNYKEGRKPPRLNRSVRNLTAQEEAENRVWQQVRVIEYLNFTPVIQFMEPLVEADDVIAYISKMTSFKEWHKVIVSSDKDFFQLLDETTILFRPTQREVLNNRAIVEKYGIHPTNFALARAIAGDASDNLSGIKGAGLATVAKRFGFLSENKTYLVEDLASKCTEQIKENSKLKLYDNILNNLETIKRNYKIMQLYSPLISVQCADKIEGVFRDYKPMLNKSGFRATLHKDGIGEVSLNDLFETFNRTISEF